MLNISLPNEHIFSHVAYFEQTVQVYGAGFQNTCFNPRACMYHEADTCPACQLTWQSAFDLVTIGRGCLLLLCLLIISPDEDQSLICYNPAWSQLMMSDCELVRWHCWNCDVLSTKIFEYSVLSEILFALAHCIKFTSEYGSFCNRAKLPKIVFVDRLCASYGLAVELTKCAISRRCVQYSKSAGWRLWKNSS